MDRSSDRWFGKAPDPDPEAPDAPRPARGGVLAAHIVMGTALAIIGVGAVAAVVAPGGTDDLTTAELRVGLWVQAVLLAVLMAVVPVVWLLATRRQRIAGTLAFLSTTRPWRGVALGLALLVATVVLAGIAQTVAAQFDEGLLENPELDTIGSALTVPLVIATALVAGFGEEILFRGVLQRWVGVVPQAILFGLVHAGYQTPMQVVVPLLIGLLFGWAVKRGASLWAPITAHVAFDLLALSAARMCAGDGAPDYCP